MPAMQIQLATPARTFAPDGGRATASAVDNVHQSLEDSKPSSRPLQVGRHEVALELIESVHASTSSASHVAAEPLMHQSGDDHVSLALREVCPLPNIAIPKMVHASGVESAQLITITESTMAPSAASFHPHMSYQGVSPSVRKAHGEALSQPYPPALLQAAVEYLKTQNLDDSRSDAISGHEASPQFGSSIRDALGPM